jgi:hypothetical protein
VSQFCGSLRASRSRSKVTRCATGGAEPAFPSFSDVNGTASFVTG